MSDTVLSVRNLRVHFQTDEQLVKAVDGINFDLKRGQTLGIVGESGSGKSVTSLAAMGLIPSPPGKIAEGEIWFRSDENSEPVDLLSLSSKQMQRYRGGEIAMIFQEPMSALNPVYTIGFQLLEAICQHRNISKAEAKRQAIAALQEVKLIAPDAELEKSAIEELSGESEPSQREILQQVNRQKSAFLDRYPHQLSGGQIQRVTIAMAIACDPTVLIADEPTTALDVTVQARILDLIRELRDRRQMSIIFITHDLGVIAEIADTVAVMYRGKIVEVGTAIDIFSRPQHPYTKGLLACRPQPDRRMAFLPTVADFMEVKTTAAGEVEIIEKRSDNATIVQQEVPAEVIASRLQELQLDRPLLDVRNLRVGFPIRGAFGRTQRYFMAVNDVSFNVYPGETLGLVGESGCGKTTLARTLLRLIEPTDGSIKFEDVEVTQLKSNRLRQLRQDMQVIFQDPFGSLNPRMTIGSAVVEPLKIHRPQNSRKENRDRVAYLLDRVGLDPAWIDRYPHEFSGGQRQRICIARSLALNPKFIICDESVSALDVSVQAQVLNLLKELQSEFGLTYIFISHDLSVVKFMSDRIVVMNRGKIEEIGPAEQIYRHPKRDYTKQLIASIPVGDVSRIRKRAS